MPVPSATPSRPGRESIPPAVVIGTPMRLALLAASLAAVALGLNLTVRPAWLTQAGAATLQRGQVFAAGACITCHAIGVSAITAAPEPGGPPAFQWIARSHPDYLDGFLLRPMGAHLLVVGDDAAGLRALFADLAQPR